ncbi:PE-PGRS family protein [Pseudonocardia dioxanivorans CB1190]|uniref:PE-PGRS family protein n=1 Tax=Pseudonocardia dioxanivorans (strain ATCC 55486 / DSM 44775 / JCM 13855 / CB1190) TaxID=675635 RepID=F4CVW2_PSEUX|nr:PE-PGRS family protein [Pseudonocardia dioxanivorans CB1190]
MATIATHDPLSCAARARRPDRRRPGRHASGPAASTSCRRWPNGRLGSADRRPGAEPVEPLCGVRRIREHVPHRGRVVEVVDEGVGHLLVAGRGAEQVLRSTTRSRPRSAASCTPPPPGSSPRPGCGERRAARPGRGAPGGRRGRRPAASGRGAQPRPRVLDLLARYAPGVREQGRPSGRGMDQRVHAAPAAARPGRARRARRRRAAMSPCRAQRPRGPAGMGSPAQPAPDGRRDRWRPAGAPRMRSAGEEPRNTGLLVERCR